MNWTEPISTIRKRLRDILVFSSVGNNVSNLDLDLLNRAQMWLSQYRQWDALVKVIPMTLDSTKSMVLPSDINAILEVYVDLAGIGKPTLWYYQNAPDIAQRYTIIDTFDSSTGHSWKISFPLYGVIQGPLYMRYSYNLADFVGTDEAGNELVEYSFFPPNLLIRCAQKMHYEDKGITGDSVQVAINAFNEELRKFELNSQYNNQQLDLTIKNRYGMPIKIYGHSLDGANRAHSYSPYLPSTNVVGY